LRPTVTTLPWKPWLPRITIPEKPFKPVLLENKLSGEDWVTIIKAGLKCIHPVVDIVKGIMGKEENCVPSSVSTHMQQIQEAGAYIENFPWNILIECIPTVVEVVGSWLKKSEENGVITDFVETMIRGFVYGLLHPSEENGWWSSLKKFAKKAVSVVKDVAGTVKDVAGGVKDIISIFKEEENFPFWIIPTAVSIIGSLIKKEENCIGARAEALSPCDEVIFGEENFPWGVLIQCIPTVVEVIGSYLKKGEENCTGAISKKQQQLSEASAILDSIENGWWTKLKKAAKSVVSVVKDVAPIAKQVISIFAEENCVVQSAEPKFKTGTAVAGIRG